MNAAPTQERTSCLYLVIDFGQLWLSGLTSQLDICPFHAA